MARKIGFTLINFSFTSKTANNYIYYTIILVNIELFFLKFYFFKSTIT